MKTLRSEEIDHYAWLISGLVVSAARAPSPERLAEVQKELEDALRGLLHLLDHVPVIPELAESRR